MKIKPVNRIPFDELAIRSTINPKTVNAIAIAVPITMYMKGKKPSAIMPVIKEKTKIIVHTLKILFFILGGVNQLACNVEALALWRK